MEIELKQSDVLELFGRAVPPEQHMLQMFADAATRGVAFQYTAGLCDALACIDSAVPGYANEMIARIAGVKGLGEPQYESLVQIASEIYVTCGAVQSADTDDGTPRFTHEPRSKNGKNPEFEACANGLWYAVEVKTPSLVAHGRRRAEASWQLTARLPAGASAPVEAPMLPRDHPVKEFLISANEKFAAYEKLRPDAVRLLTIVWDDHVHEVLAALLNPASGLLTENSFHKDDNGQPVRFPMIDAILLCRYQLQLRSMMADGPLTDGELPFVYHHNHGFPPKTLIQNPHGRPFPPELLHPLNATKLEDCVGAEYSPNIDIVLWV